MIRLFLLVVQVLTPFYWTERGSPNSITRKEGSLSASSHHAPPPSCNPLVPRHHLLSSPHHSLPTALPSFRLSSIPKATEALIVISTKIQTA